MAPVHSLGQIRGFDAKLGGRVGGVTAQGVPDPDFGRVVAGEKEHRDVASCSLAYGLLQIAGALVAVEHEDEVLDPPEFPERARVHGEFVRTGVAAYADGLPANPLAGQENVEHALQDSLRSRVFTKEIECVPGPAVEGVLDDVTVGRTHRDVAGIVPFEEDASVGGHGIEYHWAVRGDDDLQVVA